MLRLLQQRTKLSARIGETKRRSGSPIYVPARERDLVARLAHAAPGLPLPMLAAVYREIMSGSRAAQGQNPIGLLQTSARDILPAARAFFGASDQFQPSKRWGQLATKLEKAELALVLLTGANLLALLGVPRWRKPFLQSLGVLGDFAASENGKTPLERRIFILGPKVPATAAAGEHALILIECKSIGDTVKSLLHAMPKRSFHTESLVTKGTAAGPRALVRLTVPAGAALSLPPMPEAAGARLLGQYFGPGGYGG